MEDNNDQQLNQPVNDPGQSAAPQPAEPVSDPNNVSPVDTPAEPASGVNIPSVDASESVDQFQSTPAVSSVPQVDESAAPMSGELPLTSQSDVDQAIDSNETTEVPTEVPTPAASDQPSAPVADVDTSSYSAPAPVEPVPDQTSPEVQATESEPTSFDPSASQAPEADASQQPTINPPLPTTDVDPGMNAQQPNDTNPDQPVQQ